MELNYTVTRKGNAYASVIKDVAVPDSNEKVYLMAKFTDRIPTGSRITKSIYENCIISAFPDIFCARNSQLTDILIKDSIVKRMDLKKIAKMKNIQILCFENSTIEEVNDTLFESFKDLTLKFEKNPNDPEDKVIKIEGTVNLKDLKPDKVEDDKKDPLGASSLQKPENDSFKRPIQESQSFNFTFPSTLVNGMPKFNPTFGAPTPPQKDFTFESEPVLNSIEKRSKNIAQNSDQSPQSKKTSDHEHKQQLKDRNMKLITMNANLVKEVNVLQDQLLKLQTENKKLTENGFLRDLKQIFDDDVFKDFSVNVNDGTNEKRFKVHKIFLAARSSVFADEIRSSPDSIDMNLQQISVSVFEKILDFIYHDTAPDDGAELIAIYAAAGQLNIVDLKNITAVKLMDKINDVNSLKILKLSNKYGNAELRKKAFEKIKEQLPEYKMGEEFSKNPEKIEKLLELKKALDMEFQKIKQEMKVGDESDDLNPGVAANDDPQKVDNDDENADQGGSASGGTSDSYEIVD